MDILLLILVLLIIGYLVYRRFFEKTKEINGIAIINDQVVLKIGGTNKEKLEQGDLFLGMEGEFFVVGELESNPKASNKYAYYIRNKKNTK